MPPAVSAAAGSQRPRPGAAVHHVTRTTAAGAVHMLPKVYNAAKPAACAHHQPAEPGDDSKEPRTCKNTKSSASGTIDWKPQVLFSQPCGRAARTRVSPVRNNAGTKGRMRRNHPVQTPAATPNNAALIVHWSSGSQRPSAAASPQASRRIQKGVCSWCGAKKSVQASWPRSQGIRICCASTFHWSR